MHHGQLFSDFPHVDNQVICGRESASTGTQRGEEFLRLRRGLETDVGRFVLVFTAEAIELNISQARNS